MKRRVDGSQDENESTKRTRSDPLRQASDAIFHLSKQRKAADVCNGEIHDLESSFLTFQISMKWDSLPGQYHIQARESDGVTYDVFFSQRCAQFFNRIGLRFNFGDVIRLSLRGATISKKPPNSGSGLPLNLIYDNGVSLEFVSAKHLLETGSLVNFWPETQQRTSTGNAPITDDWFSTPPVPVDTQSDSVIAQSVPTEPALEQPTASSEPPSSRVAISIGQGAAPTPMDQTATPPVPPDQPPGPIHPQPVVKKLYRDTNPRKNRHGPSVASSRKQSPATSNQTMGQSKLPSTGENPKSDGEKVDTSLSAKKGVKKARREARKAAITGSIEGTDTEAQELRESPPEPIAKAPSAAPAQSASVRPKESKETSRQAPSAEFTTVKSLVTSTRISPRPKPSPSANSPKDIVGPWCPLGELASGRVSLAIGVVAAIGDISTSSASGEKYRRITLVDQTNVDADSLTSGFTLVCFDKRAAANLPVAVVGDVLVMRDMLVESHHGGRLNGSCPSYKSWSWTIFHPEDGTLRSGGPALSPHIPPPKLSTQENQYCVRLADWWMEESKRRASEGGGGGGGAVVQQISAADVGNRRGAGREHKLIKDASPHVPPGGYFDCTVEFLHGYTNNNGVYSAYVTDYTNNESVSPVHASWCIPALADLVFKIEFWNDAALQGPEMKPGDYYEMKNVRIKESTGGYWEGSFSEVKKMRKLDDEDLEEAPHLVELLKRKQAWKDEADANGTHQFPHQLIKDAQPDSHFDCTVEVLRISPKDDRALLYVTDYTARNNLSFIAATADWTRGIEHEKILKVALYQAQAKAAGALQAGDVIAVRKMRLKAIVNGTLSGLLGGEERLIFKLDPQNTGNEHCIELLERKEAWLSAQRAKEAESSRRKSKGKALPKKPLVREIVKPREQKKRVVPQRLPKTTCIRDLEKVHPDSTPGRYLLLARVVDYWPERLEDFVSLYCSNCKQDIPESLRICTHCDTDMSNSFVRPYYRFSLILEDDEGTRFSVASVCTRERPHGFLEDLPPIDLREDSRALDAFKKKIEPLFGSELVSKHQELLQMAVGGNIDPDSPFHNIVLAKLAHTDGFFFWDYTPAVHQTGL